MREMTSPEADSLTIRPYTPGDEEAILALLRVSLGEGPTGSRAPEFFRWKHLENPFGASVMLVAEADSRIVGLRAFMRWAFRSGDMRVRAVRAVDTATHPDYQGRGIFRRLTLEALELMKGDVDLVFNTPNKKSGPGYLKMGWREVGTVPIWVRPRHPLRLLARYRSVVRKGPASDATAPPSGGDPVEAALSGSNNSLDGLVLDREAGSRLCTARDKRFLQWRYARAPMMPYRAVVEEGPTEPRGIALFRTRSRGTLREAMICELLVRPGDRATARRLLDKIAPIAQADHMTCHFAMSTTPFVVRHRSRFLRAPGGIALVTNALADGVWPAPTELDSWCLSLGDMELF